ncbi:hypothetical protein BD324DRAFT_295692 [Kockovaella imperatae]|uniref:Uncharacterized protein n=1 Tax=Kockovaella imperatae TaxID=4999 RepID=A0A1Y1ULL9_9TREE|nr:hypothetical protein BD324DRAFT_295692 [Kockovaella imperatae]ORX38879.1 hypothetical protein BD324DRAFT_295692 [Kockovaella imperatae]
MEEHRILEDDSHGEHASPSRKSKYSGSPSRPHMTALSPLQAFSPLQSMSLPFKEQSAVSDKSPSLSRTSSLTRSLSRRQSLIAHAASWDAGHDYDDENLTNPMALFSRLTLVKAPSQDTGLRRAKSSSALAPFTGQSTMNDHAPATSARGPRRSFAASSFAGFTQMSRLPSPFSEGGDSLHRLSHLAGVGSGGDGGIGYAHKMLTPEQVVEMARDTVHPIAMPEGGLKGVDLKRRKSSGSGRKASSSTTDSPERSQVALEPVEYVQLDDDTLLPYVDRPQEVRELLETNKELVKLLKAAFPKEPLREHWIALPPEEWNWEEFMRHLTTVSRVQCPDYAWVFRARQSMRARCVSLWEKLGTCLGCDGDLLNAGGEDGLPSSWGGLSLGEEGEYDPSAHQVYIEALEAGEREFKEAFGEIVEDENEQAAAGMTALLGTIGEEDIGPLDDAHLTTAQKASRTTVQDPMLSPDTSKPSVHGHDGPRRPSADARHERSRSFVGLQIMTSPSISHAALMRSPSGTTPTTPSAHLPIFDRGPGSPLFPGSFSALSVEPNLGRSASVGLAGGVKAAPETFGRAGYRPIAKRQSGAGLSESAITFASESDPGLPGDD